MRNTQKHLFLIPRKKLLGQFKYFVKANLNVDYKLGADGFYRSCAPGLIRGAPCIGIGTSGTFSNVREQFSVGRNAPFVEISFRNMLFEISSDAHFSSNLQ